MDADLFEMAFKIMGAIIFFGGIAVGGILVLLVKLWRDK